jgi:D-threo-aldose 1-dehydrogenase
MEEICARHQVSLAAVALQFLTRYSAVTASIPGANVPAEAQANARAAREVIPDALWEELTPLVVTWSREAMGSEWVLTFN